MIAKIRLYIIRQTFPSCQNPFENSRLLSATNGLTNMVFDSLSVICFSPFRLFMPKCDSVRREKQRDKFAVLTSSLSPETWQNGHLWWEGEFLMGAKWNL